jgi:hypothetical protein
MESWARLENSAATDLNELHFNRFLRVGEMMMWQNTLLYDIMHEGEFVELNVEALQVCVSILSLVDEIFSREFEGPTTIRDQFQRPIPRQEPNLKIHR